jgi:chromosomal replication initiation ATPase DnaA
VSLIGEAITIGRQMSSIVSKQGSHNLIVDSQIVEACPNAKLKGYFDEPIKIKFPKTGFTSAINPKSWKRVNLVTMKKRSMEKPPDELYTMYPMLSWAKKDSVAAPSAQGFNYSKVNSAKYTATAKVIGQYRGNISFINEIQRLCQDFAAQKDSNSIMIEGKAGYGKTYLLKQARRVVSSLGLRFWYIIFSCLN